MSIERLTEKQRAAWRAMDSHPLVICEGAVRSGKSVAADHAFMDFALRGPWGNMLLAGKTHDSAARNVIYPLEDLFGRDLIRYNRGTRELYIGKRRIYVVGANDERATDKIRGLTLAGAYVDEASTVPEQFWIMLRSRLSIDKARMIATTNPDAPLHWLKRDWLDRADDLDIARFSFRVEDNPYLPPAYVESIRREFVGLWYRRFVLGEWVAAEGAVYDLFDHERHVVETLPRMQYWWLGVDYGTATVTHAVLGGLGEDGVMYIAREWRWDAHEKHRQLTDADYSRELAAWVQGGCDGVYRLNDKPAPVPLERVIVDPSAVSFIAQLRRDGWATVREADNAVLDGIRYTASLLSAGKLLVHSSCKHLLHEIDGYVWDPKAQARGDDAPLKVNDHAVDSCRYLCYTTRRYTRHGLLNIFDADKEVAA